MAEVELTEQQHARLAEGYASMAIAPRLSSAGGRTTRRADGSADALEKSRAASPLLHRDRLFVAAVEGIDKAQLDAALPAAERLIESAKVPADPA